MVEYMIEFFIFIIIPICYIFYQIVINKDKVGECVIKEGKERKGGVNPPPNKPKPVFNPIGIPLKKIEKEVDSYARNN